MSNIQRYAVDQTEEKKKYAKREWVSVDKLSKAKYKEIILVSAAAASAATTIKICKRA